MRDSNGGGQRRPRCLAGLWRPRPKGQSTSSAASTAALRVRCPGALKTWFSGDRETRLVYWEWLLPDSSSQSHCHGSVRSLRVLSIPPWRRESLPSKHKQTIVMAWPRLGPNIPMHGHGRNTGRTSSLPCRSLRSVFSSSPRAFLCSSAVCVCM